MDPLIGRVVLDRYEVLRKIGTGGMGSVYVGRQRAVGRDVALKVLRSDLMTNEHVRERFRREAEIIGKLRHPNTIQLYDYGESGEGLAVMVTELLVGSALNDRLREKGPIPLVGALQIGIEIAGSLAEAHLLGLVHRDLKPANIFLVEVAGQTHVKVLDFGIARILDEEATRLTSTGQVFGTPRYMSPEQAMSTGEVDSRSDLYSLGLILFECVVGQPPFIAQTSIQYLSAHSTKPPPKLRDQYPEAPEALEALIDACLAKDAEDRPQTADSVSEALAVIKRGVESGGGMEPIQIHILRGAKGGESSFPDKTAQIPKTVQSGLDHTVPSPKRNGGAGAGAGQTALDDKTLLKPRRPEPAKKPPVLALAIVGVVVLAGLAFAGMRLFGPKDVVITAVDSGVAEAQGAVDSGAQALVAVHAEPPDAAAAVAAHPADASEVKETEDAGVEETAPVREHEAGKHIAGAHRKGRTKLLAKGPKGTAPPVMTQQGKGVITGPAQMRLDTGDGAENVVAVAKDCHDSAWTGKARLNLKGCPANCAIVVDEKCAGRTPVAAAVSLPPGFREVAVVCGSRIRAKTQVKLVADEDAQVRCQ